MPQGERTPNEEAEFARMLKDINLLYLGASVLIMMDRKCAHTPQSLSVCAHHLHSAVASSLPLVASSLGPRNRARSCVPCPQIWADSGRSTRRGYP